MKLVLKRTALRDTYTIGKLFIDGVFFCNTLEDRDRGLTSSMTLEQIKKIKVYGETAIPYGAYKIDMDTVSPKYSKKANYAKVTYGGKMPRLKSIKGYDGVLIHGGNVADLATKFKTIKKPQGKIALPLSEDIEVY